MIIEAFIDCHPPRATAQHKTTKAVDAGFKLNRAGKLVAKHKLIMFEKGAVKSAREQLTEHFRRNAPPAPVEGPLKFTAVWSFYWNKGDLPARKKGRLPQWVPIIVPPDGDNLAKMLKDVLTELGYWGNDAHVSCETYIRGKGDRPGIHIRLEPYLPSEWYVPPEGDVVAEVEL
jgi:Holliday junction resolvase RusA-like endonuclease